MQLEAMRAYAERKGWQIASTSRKSFWRKDPPCREELLRAAADGKSMASLVAARSLGAVAHRLIAPCKNMTA